MLKIHQQDTSDPDMRIVAGTTGTPEEPNIQKTLQLPQPFASQRGCLRNHEAQFVRT